MKSITENLLLWEQRIKERIQSGITVNEWCENNHITKHHYYYWNRKVRQKEDRGEEIVFADITPMLLDNDSIKEYTDVSPNFKLLISDIQVTVPSKFNPDALAELLKVLKAL